MTVVILVLMSLVTLRLIGGQAWKRGSDRTMCVMNIEHVQKGMRGYSNLYGYVPGDLVAGLESKVIGLGKFVEKAPTCPGTGSYTTLGDQIPDVGTLYIGCSLAVSEEHLPGEYASW